MKTYEFELISTKVENLIYIVIAESLGSAVSTFRKKILSNLCLSDYSKFTVQHIGVKYYHSGVTIVSS